MSKTFVLRCESCAAPLSSEDYPLVCTFCHAENWAKDTFAFSEQRAIANLRLIHSAESTFYTFGCYRNYGTPTELFMPGLIPKALAEALNTPKMQNESGISCDGTNKPFAGYRYQLSTFAQTDSELPNFSVVALVDPETHKKGTWNFFIDATGVVRLALISQSLPNRESDTFDVELEQRVWR